MLVKGATGGHCWYHCPGTLIYTSHQSHNAVDKYSTMQHFETVMCYKMVHCGIWDWCIMGFVQQVLDTGYQKLNSTGALSSNELHWFIWHVRILLPFSGSTLKACFLKALNLLCCCSTWDVLYIFWYTLLPPGLSELNQYTYTKGKEMV